MRALDRDDVFLGALVEVEVVVVEVSAASWPYKSD